GVRERLMSLLRPGVNDKLAVAERVVVRFVLPSGAEARVNARVGETLLRASTRLAVPIFQGCHDQSCSECLVEMTPGGEARACVVTVPPGGASAQVKQLWSMEQVRGDD
ncbi:MAG: 2Fe-2S iron-sulfur cluster binding domain, partial [Pseudomonadota bacterium]